MDLYAQLCKEETLFEAWKKVRKKNARGGIDGINPEDIEKRIHKVIKDLSVKLLDCTYTPSPYHQMKVPKFNQANEWRPLSLPIVIDKIVQQAVANLCMPIFEKEFLDCSYAYRPQKGPVRAIRRVEHILRSHKPGWEVSFDIDNFFDTLNHDILISEVSKKIQDEKTLSLIQLWLNAGYISQKGGYVDPLEGIGQGSVISPLLSNIYLHVLDQYAVKKNYHYVRYSDNFIVFFSEKDGAYVCYEEIKAFLEEDLKLKLNTNPFPYKNVRSGFTFLGIYFRGDERHISRQKETKTFKKLNWMTDIFYLSKPDVLLKRLNESIQAQKRFYGFIKPERQFAAFDEHLMKRIGEALKSFHKKGLMNSKSDFVEFVRKMEFYKDRGEKEKRAIAIKVSEELFLHINREAEKKSKALSGTKEKKSGAQSRRSSAQKNRFLRMVSDQAEVIVSTPGIFIGKTGKRLILREARKNIHEHPFSKIRQITITTNGVSLSSDVIWSCGINKVPLVFINRQGKTYATLQTPNHSMGDLSVHQIRMYESDKAIKLAKKVLIGKCRNQMNVLKFYTRHRSRTDPVFSEKVLAALEPMNKEINEIKNINYDGSFSIQRNHLFTAEARVSSHYWEIIKLLLPVELDFSKRDKRGAKDVINNMLNYGYGILYQRVWNAVSTAGLNPNISFLHAIQKNKPTLIYDMIEEFRQAIVDRPIFSLMTRGNRYKRFKIIHETGLMDKFTKETTLHTVLKRLATLIGFRGKKLRAEDVIHIQARHLANFIRNRAKIYRPFISTY